MIPVQLQPQPQGFYELVEDPGNRWLAQEKIQLDAQLPEGKTLPNHWVKVLPDLWRAYGGVCAYYGFYFELASGAQSTDHFAAKSKLPGKAYQWANLRLACLEANRQKNHHSDVLDPMEIEADTFRIELSKGKIYPNPEKDAETISKAKSTISRLELDEYLLCELRARHYRWYKMGEISKDRLQRMNPFIHAELKRQNLL